MPQATPAPAAAAASKNEVTIVHWTPYESGYVRGFLDFKLPSGMILCHWTLFKKENERWISPHSKASRDPKTGDQRYSPTVRFDDKEISKRFQDSVLRALDQHLAELKR